MPKPFEELTVPQQESLYRQAVEFLDRTDISFREADRDTVYYLTAIYLWQLKEFTVRKEINPKYVVHCLEENWRFVSDSRALCFARYKNAIARKTHTGSNRVAMFYYDKAGKQTRLYASEGYPFEVDREPK